MQRLVSKSRAFICFFPKILTNLPLRRASIELANLRLELASMAADQAEFAASIQLFEAQASLNLAVQRLQHSERLAARGYITDEQLRADQLDVERLRSRVDSIQNRLRESSSEEQHP